MGRMLPLSGGGIDGCTCDMSAGCCAGVPTSFTPSDVFGDVTELAGVNSKISPRAFALAGCHPTSDPNPMGNFSRQPPSTIGGPGTLGGPAAAAQSALLSQQLHAAAARNSKNGVGAGGGAQPQQRVCSVADMATSLGLERLYQHGERQQQQQQSPAQNPVEAVYGAADRALSHGNLSGAGNTANALRNSGGMSPHLSPQAQAVARLASQDRSPGSQQRISIGGEEPSNGGTAAAAHHLEMPPPGPQGGFPVGPQGTQAAASQLGAAGNDPFLQLLQGLKVAKALQGGREAEEPQHHDAHYRALVQMLAQRNAQTPPVSVPGSAGMPVNNAASSVGHLSPGSQEAALGCASRSLNNVFDVHRLNTKVGSQGTIAGLEDMHALASLVAHSTGMPAARAGGSQGGYAGLPGGLAGGLGIEQHHRSVAAAGADVDPAPGQVPSAPPAFHGGSGANWDVGSKQLQVRPGLGSAVPLNKRKVHTSSCFPFACVPACTGGVPCVRAPAAPIECTSRVDSGTSAWIACTACHGMMCACSRASGKDTLAS